MRRLAHTARNVGGKLAVLLALALLLVDEVLPRRVPDLRRLIARRDVAEAHGVITSWLDRHFELIESQAPWLHPVGRRVEDSCRTTWWREPWSLEHKPPGVVCTRRVSIWYGCGGDPPTWLIALGSALSAIGWGNVRGGTWHMQSGYGQPASQALTLSWTSVGELAHELPSLAGQSDALLKSASMYVSWTDRAESDDMVAPLSSEATDRARATLQYQPVEVSGDEEVVLAARALLGHEHAVTIEVSADYYQNENVNARPDRLRKRLRVVSG